VRAIIVLSYPPLGGGSLNTITRFFAGLFEVVRAGLLG
jgi:hypothetical protein